MDLARTALPSALLVALAVLGVAGPAYAQSPPAPCPADQVGTLRMSMEELVATRSDNGVFPIVTLPEANNGRVDEDSIRLTTTAPASIEFGDPIILNAPQPGPLAISGTWLQTTRTGTTCTGSGTTLVLVRPVRIPQITQHPVALPTVNGPAMSWPCPDERRATDAKATIVARYERGLKKAPSASSKSVTMAFTRPCEVNLKKAVRGAGSGAPVLVARLDDFDNTRYRAVLNPVAKGDMRVRIEISWGATKVLERDYAIVATGRRPNGSAVWVTTTPGRAAAVARRYARQRRGAPYIGAEERLVRDQLMNPRIYRVDVAGSFAVDWTAARGNPGDAGCTFIREAGTDRGTFDAKSGGLPIRARITRTYTPTVECPPPPSSTRPTGITCPLTDVPLRGAATTSVVPTGGTRFDGRRAPTATVTAVIFTNYEGTCPGWQAQFQPVLAFDAPSAKVARLRPGRTTKVKLAVRESCVESLGLLQGEGTSCTLSISATATVKRIR